jgi:hypothetical protein
MKRILFLAWLLLSIIPSLILGQIVSQWRGPNRDGIYAKEKLLKKWPDKGPPLLWSVDGLGEGYSSAAVTKDRIYLTGMSRGEGFLFAFDKNGKVMWKSSYGPEWDGSRPPALLPR